MFKCFIFIIFVTLSFSNNDTDKSSYLALQIVNENQEPVEGAIIGFLNLKTGTISDKFGFFQIDSSENINKIKISHIGYKTKTIEIEDLFTNSIIILSSTIKNLNDIVVTGARKETYIKDSPVLTHVITSEDIENSTYTSVKDILELKLPNVQNVISSHAGTSNDNVKVQGLDNKYMLFLIDGVRVTAEFAGNTDFKMLNLSNVEKIEIVEGGMSSLYGSSAIGGVVNIITKRNTEPYWLKYSYLNDKPLIESQSINTGFNYKKFRYALNLNYEKSDGYDLTPPAQNQTGAILKTLEKYSSESIGHSFLYNFNKNFSSEINLNRYSNTIDQYQNHLVMVLDQNNELYPNYYYSSSRNNSPVFDDKRYGLNFKWKNSNSNINISLNQEKHIKSNYFFNYTELDCGNNEISYFCNNSNDLISKTFVNAKNINKNILIQYDRYETNYNFSIGFEQNNDSYSSYNIYNYNGDLNNDNECNGSGTPWDPYDCIVQSIFGGVDKTNKFNKKALFLGFEFNHESSDKASFAIRYIDSENYGNEFVYSFAHIIKRYQPIDIRFNFSKGFRIPAIKELYYNFVGHSPPVIGNQNLLPTTNNYYSFSINERLLDRNISGEIFYNDVKDMIGINYDTNSEGEDILLYSNFKNVSFLGFNLNYENKISSNEKIQFIYNHTNPKSNNSEALDLISRNSLTINYINEIINNKLNLIMNMKYSGDKFFSNGDEKITLDEYFIFDLTAVFNIRDVFDLKFGFKNVFDYKDKRYLLSDDYERDILSSYDPGRRFVIGFNLKLNKGNIKND